MLHIRYSLLLALWSRIVCAVAGNWEIARVLGFPVLNNRHLSAEEAYKFGLINRMTSVESYLDEALQLATEIAERAPLAVRLGKEAINHAFQSNLSDGIADERRSFYFLFSSEDQKEGMQAFVERRKPMWKGK